MDFQNYDLHVHTSFSDGKNTPKEMIEAAIDSGLERIGISDHSYTSFDESYCMLKERYYEYRTRINALKLHYSDKIAVSLGIEQDFYSDDAAEDFDHIIGSVHYIKAEPGSCYVPHKGICESREKNGNAPEYVYIPVDESPEILEFAADNYFGGDIYKLAEEYYKTVKKVVFRTRCDIIGHFDLISKFNEISPLFDENDPRYVNAWQDAALTLISFGVPFEINTGAISRGYRTVPYPSYEMISFIRDRGGSFLLSSDAHSAENIAYGFDEFYRLL